MNTAATLTSQCRQRSKVIVPNESINNIYDFVLVIYDNCPVVIDIKTFFSCNHETQNNTKINRSRIA